MKADSKYKASIKLSAIGDALGWITEFEKNADSLLKKYNTNIIKDFVLWEKNVGGRFVGFKDKILPGSYSDDTQLMLAVSRCIKSDGTVDNERFGKVELPNWLLYARGGGRTVKKSAEKIKRKSIKWFENYFTYRNKDVLIDYRDCGANGAAMRVLPIALANFGNFEIIKKEVFFNSIITHGHPRAIIGALLYCYAINLILQNSKENFSSTKFISIIGKNIKSHFTLNFLNNEIFNQWSIKWNYNRDTTFLKVYNNVLEEIIGLLRIIYKGLNYKDNDFDILRKLGCYSTESKGSGTGTVCAGIFFAAKYFDQPQIALVNAVNSLGSDTDSIAAFTGGLLGALHGQGIIPEKWKNVQDFEYFDYLGGNLLAISENNFVNIHNPLINNNNIKEISDNNDWNYKVGDEIFFNPIGKGVVKTFEKRKTLTKKKFIIILSISFDIGQTCIFHKLVSEIHTNI